MSIPAEWNLTSLEKKNLEKIIKLYENDITSIVDLTGEEKPSKLFYTLAPLFHYLLDTNPNNKDMTSFIKKQMSSLGITNREAIHPIIEKLGPSFLSAEQKFIDRNTLEELDSPEKRKLNLSSDPVIYCCNHAFRDDILASVLAGERHAYLLFASLPQFMNTFDGITAWLNGVVLMNRKVKSSKEQSFKKSIDLVNKGKDIIIFPEGVWNKSPNLLMLELWKGAIEISKATGAKIVPMIHHIDDPTYSVENNKIHTLLDNPISFEDMPTEEAKKVLRDIMASNYYSILEKYSQDERKNLLSGFSSSEEAWDEQLRKRRLTADRYDVEIETSADYRDKKIIRPEDVYSKVAEAPITPRNASHVMAAKQLIKKTKYNDFQRRY